MSAPAPHRRDHYGGLSRSFNAGVIYGTPTTLALVASQLRVAQQHLRPIPLNTPTPLQAEGATAPFCTITLLDANHCPGAAMALIELPNGTAHLHVGECRVATALAAATTTQCPAIIAPSPQATFAGRGACCRARR